MTNQGQNQMKCSWPTITSGFSWQKALQTTPRYSSPVPTVLLDLSLTKYWKQTERFNHLSQTQVSSKKQGSRGFWHFRTPWLLAILSNSTSKDRFILMKNCNKNLPEQDNFVFLSFAVLKIKEYFFLGKNLLKNRESL